LLYCCRTVVALLLHWRYTVVAHFVDCSSLHRNWYLMSALRYIFFALFCLQSAVCCRPSGVICQLSTLFHLMSPVAHTHIRTHTHTHTHTYTNTHTHTHSLTHTHTGEIRDGPHNARRRDCFQSRCSGTELCSALQCYPILRYVMIRSAMLCCLRCYCLS
jgi:hypothetical protein